MEMSAAQATSVVASPAFMSVEEIRELERVVDEHRARCGTEWRWAEDGRGGGPAPLEPDSSVESDSRAVGLMAARSSASKGQGAGRGEQAR